jgi:hypothetical protein
VRSGAARPLTRACGRRVEGGPDAARAQHLAGTLRNDGLCGHRLEAPHPMRGSFGGRPPPGDTGTEAR